MSKPADVSPAWISEKGPGSASGEDGGKTVLRREERRGVGDVELRWNIHKFPDRESRRTEDIDFDWSMSPSDYMAKSRRDDGGGQVTEADAETDAGTGAPPEPAKDEPAGEDPARTEDGPAGEDPAREAKAREAKTYEAKAREAKTLKTEGTAAGVETPAPKPKPVPPIKKGQPDFLGRPFDSGGGRRRRERFFTFDQKNAEFQKLLDKERERLQIYDSPIISEARDMLAELDPPIFFDGKRIDPSTSVWDSAAFRRHVNREAGGGARTEAGSGTDIKPETEPKPAIDLKPETEPKPAIDLKFETEPKPAIGLKFEPEAAPGGFPDAYRSAAVTEAELSISKTLDAIEKEIEEWEEERDKLSRASKVAVVISLIFLMFTGGSAAVKYLAPDSPVDLWFDSVQLRAAATIKHGVDSIRDYFNDPGGEAQ
jgi:hypothetical protein